MYTSGSKLGKFEGCESRLIGELLYSMDSSWHDESCGDVGENGRWYALVHGKRYSFIVTECDQGFVSYDVYDDKGQAAADWVLIESTIHLNELEVNQLRPCPVCGGQLVVLGMLGNVLWLRCVDCGMEYKA